MIPLLLHPPKTGGTSIHNALIEHYGRLALPMPTDRTDSDTRINKLALHRKYAQFEVPIDYPAVLCVRNPYTRAWSLFRHSLVLNNLSANENQLAEWFERFVKLAVRKNRMNTEPASNWLCEQVIDLIRYESYAEDVKRVYQLDINKHKHYYNTGSTTDVEQIAHYFTESSLDTVNYMFSKDFDQFGYTKHNYIHNMRGTT